MNTENDYFCHLTYLEVASLCFAPSFSVIEASSPKHQAILDSPHFCYLTAEDGKLFDAACFYAFIVAPAEWSAPL
jgi:hypothetical protein